MTDDSAEEVKEPLILKNRNGDVRTRKADDVLIMLRDRDDPKGILIEDFFDADVIAKTKKIEVCFLHVPDCAFSLDVRNYHGFTARESASLCKNQNNPLQTKTLESKINPLIFAGDGLMFSGLLQDGDDWNKIKNGLNHITKRDEMGRLVPEEMVEERLIDNYKAFRSPLILKSRSCFQKALDGEYNYSPFAHRRKVKERKQYNENRFCPFGNEGAAVKLWLAQQGIWFDCCGWDPEERRFKWFKNHPHKANTLRYFEEELSR